MKNVEQPLIIMVQMTVFVGDMMLGHTEVISIDGFRGFL